jgi:hypothetical protein
MQSDLPENLKHLKLYASMFPELHQTMTNSFTEYTKNVICESFCQLKSATPLMVIMSIAPAEICKRQDALKASSQLEAIMADEPTADDLVASSDSDTWDWVEQDFKDLLQLDSDLTCVEEPSPDSDRKPVPNKASLIPPPSRRPPAKHGSTKLPTARWRVVREAPSKDSQSPDAKVVSEVTVNTSAEGAKARGSNEAQTLADAKAVSEAKAPTPADPKVLAEAEAFAEAEALADAKAAAEAKVKALANAKAAAEAKAKDIANAKAAAEAKAKAKDIADAKAAAEAKAKAIANAKAAADAKALAQAKASKALANAKALANTKALANAKALANSNAESLAENPFATNCLARARRTTPDNLMESDGESGETGSNFDPLKELSEGSDDPDRDVGGSVADPSEEETVQESKSK